MGARSIPLFFIGMPAGVIADRLPRHRLMIMTGIGQGLTAIALGVLTLLGLVSLTAVLALTFLAGMIRGIEQAARQSYAHDVIGIAAFVNGLAVLGVAMRVGWLFGSLVAGGVIAHFGSGMAYLPSPAAISLGRWRCSRHRAAGNEGARPARCGKVSSTSSAT
jgi:MFS family permease